MLNARCVFKYESMYMIIKKTGIRNVSNVSLKLFNIVHFNICERKRFYINNILIGKIVNLLFYYVNFFSVSQ